MRLQDPKIPAPTDDAGQTFALWGALWTLGLEEPPNAAVGARLFDLFGSAAAAAADECRGEDGEGICARRCAEHARFGAELPREQRLALLEDVVNAAAGDGRFDAARRKRAAEVAELLGLSPGDVATLAAEHADPEFADYKYRLDQEIEVQFDDEWTAGVVRKIAPTGNLRVFFPATGETLWLSPTADVLRPAERPPAPAVPPPPDAVMVSRVP